MQWCTVCKVDFASLRLTEFACERSTSIVRKQIENQRRRVISWEKWPRHTAALFYEWEESEVILIVLFLSFFSFSQGYHRPNHYIATQGKNTNFLKIAKALWVWMCGRWEFKAVCLFGEMDVCRCLANISPNIPVVVYIRFRKLLFDAQSSVRSGESGTAHYTHTHTHTVCAHTPRHTLMDLWARRAARFLSLSVSSLPSIGGVGAINQAVWEGAE